jgi:hypothetical protein
VAAAFASGATDREIGRRFGLSHVSAGRHRREHLVRPLQAAAVALDRGRAVREGREDLLERVLQGDPTAIFKSDSIAADIVRIASRLDMSADQAASGRQHTAHAALAAQLLRQAEIRAKIGAVGGFAPSRAPADGAAREKFTVNIVFANAGRTETIATAENYEPSEVAQELGEPEG